MQKFAITPNQGEGHSLSKDSAPFLSLLKDYRLLSFRAAARGEESGI
jgi:hypothetical protein